jgi:hypothetical protein
MATTGRDFEIDLFNALRAADLWAARKILINGLKRKRTIGEKA